MEFVAPIILAVVALLGAFGASVKFIWSNVEKRFTKIESDLKLCEARENIAEQRREIYRTALELLWAELKRISPESPVLVRASKLMEDLKHQEQEAILIHKRSD